MAAKDKDLASALEAIIGANDDPSTVTQFLSTGYPELDYALSNSWTGGVAGGRLIEIAGPPSSGKTAIATAIMAHAQKLGGIVGYMDHERSFDTKLGQKLGLDISPGRFIFKKPRTFEDSIEICIKAATAIRKGKLIPEKAPIVWVFDSLAAMVPQSALLDAKTGRDKEAGERNMNDNTALSRATSAHFPPLAQIADELGMCVIFLNQIRIDIKVIYGDNRKTAGGNNKEFYFSQRIMLSASKIKKSSSDPTVVGTQITAIINKNKCAPPWRTATWRFEFQPDGTGKFNTYRSLIEFLDGEKLLTKEGNYIVWGGVKHFPAVLADKLEAAGAWNELMALLPKEYEPPTVEPEGAE